MIERLGARSIRQKLFISVLLTTLSALFIFAASIVAYDLRDYRQRLTEDLTTQSELIGLTTAPALQFNDASLASTSLELLKTRPQILGAAIYNANGTIFATYSQDQVEPLSYPPLPDVEGYRIVGSEVHAFHRIVENNEILGTVYLVARYQLYDRLWQYGQIVLATMLLALLVSMLLSMYIQRQVTRPVLKITSLARQVAEQRNFSLRADKVSNDETGYLVDAFNDLLSEVESRSAALETSNRQLQQQIRERAEAIDALSDSELRHRTLLNALTAVVWTADAEGNFGADQEPWHDYTGQSPHQYLGQGWLEAIHDSDRGRFEETWRQARLAQSTLDCELQLWHAETASYRYVRLSAVPLYDNRGALLEWIGTADDIDDRRRGAEEIQKLNAELEHRVAARTDELERANKELEAFSYSVSHDLRTPLRAIDGFSQALLEDYAEQLDDVGQDYLRRVRAGAQRMGRLIDDLLKLARVSRTEINRDVVDLSRIAKDILAELQANDPGRSVTARVTSQLSASCDPHLMRIVLENLLNNAWKYTSKKDHAEIEFGMRLQDGEPCYFVEDNGAGFDMAYAGKLFGAFQRLHDAKEYSGTGVGLATVQRIIHRHGGRIWANAAAGQGAVFYFTLPLIREFKDEYETHSVG